jgi:hypothetical protein
VQQGQELAADMPEVERRALCPARDIDRSFKVGLPMRLGQEKVPAHKKTISWP